MARRLTGRRSVAAVALAAVALGGAVAWGADEPANVIKYRQNFMKANGAHLSMISAIVKGEVSFTDELVPHAQMLAEQAKLATADLQVLFPEGTGKGAVEGVETIALPSIWENWSGFEQAAQRFEEETARFAEVAQGGDMTAIAQALGQLGTQGCGGCHEDFREKKN